MQFPTAREIWSMNFCSEILLEFAPSLRVIFDAAGRKEFGNFTLDLRFRQEARMKTMRKTSNWTSRWTLRWTSNVAVASLFLIIFSASLVATAPIPPPDLWDCSPITVFGQLTDCCLPTDVPRIKEFQFPDPSEPMRVRRSSNYLDQASKEKMNLAYQRMRALPDHDPRSMYVQQKIHCAYCAGVYRQQNSTKLLQIHRSWLAFPYHRWYVYFHERILASLIDDPTFTIPYWNWDNQSTAHNPIPNAFPKYLEEMPALADAHRDPRSSSPNFPNLAFIRGMPGMSKDGDNSEETVRKTNNVIMHEAMVNSGAFPSTFVGYEYRFDDDSVPMLPSFEAGPHSDIHSWVGDNSHMDHGEDMAPPYAAARDPIFFQHHSNVDRLWVDWENLGGPRVMPDDPDFLDASFYFYDEKGDLVRVTIAQSLDKDKLRYRYEPAENTWLEDVSVSLTSAHLEQTNPKKTSSVSRILWNMLSFLAHPTSSEDSEELQRRNVPAVESVTPVRVSGSPFHSRVSRPHAALRAAGMLDGLEEVLTLEGIRIPSENEVWFDIFVNLPNANEETPIYATEWCGRFSNALDIESVRRLRLPDPNYSFSLPVGEKLKKLRLVDRKDLVVSLVPQGTLKHEGEVKIDTLTITLQ